MDTISAIYPDATDEGREFITIFGENFKSSFYSREWAGTISGGKAKAYEIAISAETKNVLKSFEQFFRYAIVDGKYHCFLSFDHDLALDVSFYKTLSGRLNCMFYTIAHEGVANMKKELADELYLMCNITQD